VIQFKSGKLSKKDKVIIENLLNEITDIYKDFYVTRSNLRLFLRENQDILFECLQKGDKIIFGEEDGIILIYGFSDKAKRIYLKILAKDENSASRLLKIVNWSIKTDLYAKIKKLNPLMRVLERNGFRYLKDRGVEALLFRQYISQPTQKIRKDNAEE